MARSFPDRFGRTQQKLECFWGRLSKRFEKLLVKLVRGGLNDAAVAKHVEAMLVNHLKHRNRQHRKAFANLVRNHKRESIALSIGGRDCDGYDWSRTALYELNEKDFDDKVITCPLAWALRSARNTHKYADGPTSHFFMTKEEYNELPDEKPVGRCGWDDDSMEPWTPEEAREYGL